MQLAEVNTLDEREFVERLGAVFEHSAWVAERAWKKKPFSSVERLHEAMMQSIRSATRNEQLALARAHPELAGAEARDATLTASSSSEQTRLGFTALSKAEFLRMAEINRRYREKFGFPCIVALALHSSRSSVIAEMGRRLANDGDTELAAALEQVGHIGRGRLARIFGEG